MEKKLSYIKSLQMIHGALLMGQAVFLTIAFYLAYNVLVKPAVLDEQLATILQSVLLGFCIIMAYLSFIIYKNRIRALQQNNLTVPQTLTAYRAANLVRWAMLEAPVLLVIVYGLLTNSKPAFILAALVLVVFVLSRPQLQKTIAETGLSEAEIEATKL